MTEKEDLIIKERARQYSNKLVTENSYNGYLQGAIEQKKIDIDKVCNLLHDLLIEEDETYLGNAGILKDKIDKFRKAMEE